MQRWSAWLPGPTRWTLHRCRPPPHPAWPPRTGRRTCAPLGRRCRRGWRWRWRVASPRWRPSGGSWRGWWRGMRRRRRCRWGGGGSQGMQVVWVGGGRTLHVAVVACLRGRLIERKHTAASSTHMPPTPPLFQNLPEAALLLATPAAAKANAPQLQHLAVWAPLPLLDALALAAGPAGRHPAVLAYVMRSLGACAPEDVAFFLPQLVQARGAGAGGQDPQAEVLTRVRCGSGCPKAGAKQELQRHCRLNTLGPSTPHPPSHPPAHPPSPPSSCCAGTRRAPPTAAAAPCSASCWTQPPAPSTLPTCWCASCCRRARRPRRLSTQRCGGWGGGAHLQHAALSEYLDPAHAVSPALQQPLPAPAPPRPPPPPLPGQALQLEPPPGHGSVVCGRPRARQPAGRAARWRAGAAGRRAALLRRRDGGVGQAVPGAKGGGGGGRRRRGRERAAMERAAMECRTRQRRRTAIVGRVCGSSGRCAAAQNKKPGRARRSAQAAAAPSPVCERPPCTSPALPHRRTSARRRRYSSCVR
jgi:hypothetical protein